MDGALDDGDVVHIALLGVEIVHDYLHDAGVAAIIQTHLDHNVVCALVRRDEPAEGNSVQGAALG